MRISDWSSDVCSSDLATDNPKIEIFLRGTANQALSRAPHRRIGGRSERTPADRRLGSPSFGSGCCILCLRNCPTRRKRTRRPTPPFTTPTHLPPPFRPVPPPPGGARNQHLNAPFPDPHHDPVVHSTRRAPQRQPESARATATAHPPP